MLLLAIGLTTLGMRGAVSCGHDFDFHLNSWMDVARAWREGAWLPAWAPGAAWLAGEPRFVFYPPLTWAFGALLGSVFGATAVGWTLTAWLFVFVALVSSGLATRRLAEEWLSPETAQLAGLLAILSPYTLFTAFERSALAELAAAPFVPLAILCATRACRTSAGTGQGMTYSISRDRSALMLALTIAGCWLTNAPAAVMLCYMLAGVALVVAASERAWWPVVRASAAVIVGLGLAAFYLVPAALEQRWVNIRAANDPGMRVDDSWLFARHADAALAFHDAVLRRASIVFALMVAATLLAALAVARPGGFRHRDRAHWLPLLLLVPVVGLMQFRVSAMVWHALPKLGFLQFPWRLTMLLTPVFAIVVAQALIVLRKGLRTGVMAIAVAAAGYAGFAVFHQACDDQDNIAAQMVQSRREGFPPTDEYAPLGSDNAMLAAGLPSGCLIANPNLSLGAIDEDGQLRWTPLTQPCMAIATATELHADRQTFTVLAPRAGFVLLRLRRFPAWKIRVNGKPETDLPAREDGLCVLPVRAGSNRIDARWVATPETLVGRWISLFSLMALLAWLFLCASRGSEQPETPADGLH